jgi:L-lactate dehydrogenase (cytochrome)
MAQELGFKALVVTVDTPVLGKREEDERYMAELEHEAGVLLIPRTGEWLGATRDKEERVLRGGIDSSSLNWDDLVWMREAWGNTGPFVLKGIQTAEDAKKAVDLGIDGIYLSNHGGRQLDCAPSSIKTLLEIRRFCPEIIGKIEIYMDGGFRRGQDVVKALCLGATAVSCGRPFMYALGVYGTEGVLKVIQRKCSNFLPYEDLYLHEVVLSDEVETTLRLLGVTSLDQLSPDFVNTTMLDWEIPGSLRAFQTRSRL